MIKTFLHCVLVSCLPFLAVAQKANFQFYNTQDGLAGSWVHNAVQGGEGFIWVFNEFKLFRFDGRNFEPYPVPTEIAGHDVDIRGGIFYRDSFLAGTNDEYLFLLNTSTGKWQAYPYPFEQNGKKEINGLYPFNEECKMTVRDVDTNILSVWSFKDGQFSRLPYPDIPPGEWHSWKIGPEGNFFLFNNAFSIDNSFEIWTPHQETPDRITPEGLPEDARIVDLVPFQNDSLVFLSEWNRHDDSKRHHQVLYTLNYATGETRPHPANRFIAQSGLFSISFNIMENGDIWLQEVDRGIYHYDVQRDTLIDYTDLTKATIPNKDDVYLKMQDHSGTYWFGSSLGLLKATLKEPAFENYLAAPFNQCGGHCSFRGMTEDAQGNIWASFYHGIVQFDPGSIKTVKFYPYPVYDVPLPSGLFADENGLWLNNGSLMNLQTGEIRDVEGAKNFDKSEEGFLTQGPNGQLWWLLRHELFYLTKQQGEMEWEKAHELPLEEYLATNSLQVGKYSGNVYIGHQGKLMEYSLKTKKEEWHELDSPSIPLTRILAIEEDEAGLIWLATDVGLVKYDLQNKQAKRFTTEDGLTNDFVCGMLAEGDSCLWLSTNHGLSRFHKGSQTFINFYEEDGLSHNEFNRKSYYKASDGRMYFGGLRGISAFYPDELIGNLRRQNAKARVALSSFEYVDEQQDSTIRRLDFTVEPTIHIHHWHRSFSFEYVLTDFSNPTEVNYSYQMEGYEDVWSTPSKFNFTRFSSLPSGKYIFRVKAKDSHGLWHPNQLKVNIIVHPPWWATWWAYLAYVLLLLAIGFTIFYYSKKRWQLQNELKTEQAEANRLKELDSFKSQLYTNLTHEFRTPLTVILGMTNQIKNQPDKYLESGTRLIETNGKNLLRLINQLLDLSKLENKSFQLNLQNGDIIPYLRYITESFQTFANSKNLSLRFFTTLEKQEMDFDPEQIKQVMTNLISNAVKFTPSGGEVKVKVGRSGNDLLEMVFTDTGIGISAENLPHIFDRFYQVDGSQTRQGEGTGIGLAHSQELVKLMGGKIAVESELKKGTIFKVLLPITQLATSKLTEGPLTIRPNNPVPVPSPTENPTSTILHSQLPSLLIIEDNPDVVVYLKSCLEGLYQLDVAYNGKIGIEKALEHIPDLIISDVMMPEKDGYEVCDTLKNDERSSHIPIVLLTAKADAASKLTGLRRGADTYLAKPFDKEELLVWLEKLLERQQRMAAYFSKKIQGNGQGRPVEKAIQEAVEAEDAFIQKVRKIVSENYSDESFGLPQLCQKIGMSRSQLFRKMKALIGRSPSEFIRTYRLNEAKSLLKSTELNVSEVAWKVGYKDLAHFSKSFQEAFGVPPSATNK
ncbi:MAG: ATP-binding protein [Bacteroidota bacterium]